MPQTGNALPVLRLRCAMADLVEILRVAEGPTNVLLIRSVIIMRSRCSFVSSLCAQLSSAFFTAAFAQAVSESSVDRLDFWSEP